jgi:hypothetical protein
MNYRVNYGNGQVSRTYESKRDAMKERAALEDPGGSFIEYYAECSFDSRDPGYWFACGNGLGSYANTR